ncbi:MAG: ARMT1-like domain-containing protein [Planctomycetota bacterium]|nr:ARMT1-like domain-containing protein [Planctomycetota bacterium]
MTQTNQLSPFRKLANPSSYQACSWDLTTEPIGREHWVAFFKRHLETILNLGIEAAVARGQARAEIVAHADACRTEFIGIFDAFSSNPTAYDRVTILTLDTWRDQCLRRHGFVDPFIDLKNRENEKTLPLLPTVCRQIDVLTGEKQLEAIILGIFAGNIFDMGAEATARAFLNQSPDFFATRASITPRPWLIDDYDSLSQRLLSSQAHRKAVFFIDNAGSDFLLGAIPMMRWLAQRGTKIVLAANDRPTLNDMTIADVRQWWPRVLQAEPSLKNLPIEFVGTGTGEPLIDLSQVSAALNDASKDADFVILEGMGRGVESNLDVQLSCDVLNIAMIKDQAVADRHHGKVFDVVCRFRRTL